MTPMSDAARLELAPGGRLRAGFQQAMAVPRPRAAAAAYLAAFGSEIKSSGFLAEPIARHDVSGLSVADHPSSA